jgi:hypothetical protein
MTKYLVIQIQCSEHTCFYSKENHCKYLDLQKNLQFMEEKKIDGVVGVCKLFEKEIETKYTKTRRCLQCLEAEDREVSGY